MLGADTRATEGDTVADKECEKIHYIADNIWCCGAGTSADTENTTLNVSSQLELHRLATGKQPRVVTACTMLKRMLFRYQGHVSAALVLGGVDCNGPSLYTVYPHGSTDSLPYVTMGSGSLAAMAVFEAEYKSGMDVEQAKRLVLTADAVGLSTLAQRVESRQLARVRGHNQLAAPAVSDPVLLTETVELAAPLHASARLEAAGLVVDAGVDDPAVAR